MATTGLQIQQRNPAVPMSEEPTKDAQSQGSVRKLNLSQDDEKKLLDIVRYYCSSWEWKRRGIVQNMVEAKEFDKGNQIIGIDGDAQPFNSMDAYNNFTSTGGSKQPDLTLFKYCTNFYQMLRTAFEAALSAQTPKTRFSPEDADQEEDRETAAAASRVQIIIEHANNVKSLTKQKLRELFNCGCYFTHTRYVVDADRTGTHKEVVLSTSMQNVIPDRYVCFQCGAATPAEDLSDAQDKTCPRCGAPLGSKNFYAGHSEDMPVADEKQDVPNGMVLQTVYSGINVDVDPDADGLVNTPLLRVAEEVHNAWLKSTFKDKWEQLTEGNTGGSQANNETERIYRQALTAPVGQAIYAANNRSDKPTYERVWIHPWAFAQTQSREDAERFMAEMPDGCCISYVGEMVLDVRQARLTDEWTWCGSMKTGQGMYPTAVGQPAISPQKRINDMINIVHEYMDRMSCGIILANTAAIDTKAMSGKRLLPGVLNPIALKQSQPISNIENLIFQVKVTMDQAVYPYIASTKSDMQLLVATPPQVFGGDPGENVQTASGQRQQLTTGMGKLSLFWDNMREESAEAAENGIKCAAKNMTEDWKNVVTDQTKQFRNEYVHLDQMKGSVHAEPETDQGFPMTAAEQRDWWMSIISNKDPMVAQMILSEPANMDAALRSTSIPGLVAPGGNMRGKLLQVIDALVSSAPQRGVIDPISGHPVDMPSVLPIKLDDHAEAQKFIKSWAQEHWDKLKDNKDGLDNLTAYFVLSAQMEAQEAQQKAMMNAPPPPPGAQGPPPGAGPHGPQMPPPQGPPPPQAGMVQ